MYTSWYRFLNILHYVYTVFTRRTRSGMYLFFFWSLRYKVYTTCTNSTPCVHAVTLGVHELMQREYSRADWRSRLRSVHPVYTLCTQCVWRGRVSQGTCDTLVQTGVADYEVYTSCTPCVKVVYGSGAEWRCRLRILHRGYTVCT